MSTHQGTKPSTGAQPFALSELVDDELSRASSQISYGEVDGYFAPLPQAGELDPAQLAEVISRCEERVAAAQMVIRAYKHMLSDELAAAGAGSVRLGGRLFRRGKNRTYLLPSEVADQFLDYVGADLTRVVNMKRAVRAGELKKLAKERGDNPAAIVDTFLEVQEDDSVITVVPVDRGPQYLQSLPEGGWR